jgi:hypothetical protein
MTITDADIDYTIDSIEVDAMLHLLLKAIASLRGEPTMRAATTP